MSWGRVATAAALGLTVSCAGDDEGADGGASRCGPSHAVVARVIDGDTVELDSGERVRYLLIDTPESTQGATDCFGSESAAFNRQLVEGQEIELTYDVDCEDRYDRLLAYITIDGRDLNLLMVERGYACVLSIPPNGEERRNEFEIAEQIAKNGMVGMWGACDEVTCE
jgi:micrococcal nuclease